MAYPPSLARLADHSQDEASTGAVLGSAVDSEIAALMTTVNLLIQRIRNITDAAGNLSASSVTANQVVKGFKTYTATASQTVFLLSPYTADTTVDTAMVWANGTLIAPASVTLAASQVTIPAQSSGVVVVVLLLEVGQSLKTLLASTSNAEGASLIGIEDAAGILTATNVEDALEEIQTAVDTLESNLGTGSEFLKKDGSVAATGALPMGGNKVTGLAAASANGDAVRYEQLVSLTNQISAVTATFLALAGGTMSGPIAMGTNKITGMGDPTNAQDAATKAYVDAADALKLPLAGGTMTGPIAMGTQKITGMGDPTANQDAATKKYVDDTVTAGAGVSGFRHRVVVTATGAGVWNTPAGITRAMVEMWGGGGGSNSGGGGAGEYGCVLFSIDTPLAAFNYNVGVAGAISGGGNGGDTWFGTASGYVANGASGVNRGSGGSAAAIANATVISSEFISGGRPLPATGTDEHGGASPRGGAGGDATPTAGDAPGGGGGFDGTGPTGGDGARGQLVIWY